MTIHSVPFFTLCRSRSAGRASSAPHVSFHVVGQLGDFVLNRYFLRTNASIESFRIKCFPIFGSPENALVKSEIVNEFSQGLKILFGRESCHASTFPPYDPVRNRKLDFGSLN